MGWQHYTYTNTHIHWRRIAAYPREVRSRAAPHYIHFMQLLMLRDALVCCLINLTPPALYTVLCVSPVLLSCCAAESVKLLSLHSSRIQLGLRVGAILRVVCSQSDTARGWIMYQKLNCHCGDDFICHHKGRQQQAIQNIACDVLMIYRNPLRGPWGRSAYDVRRRAPHTARGCSESGDAI